MERERKINRAKEREKRGETGGRILSSLPSFFPALSLALVFARAPLSERLEQANSAKTIQLLSIAVRFWTRTPSGANGMLSLNGEKLFSLIFLRELYE